MGHGNREGDSGPSRECCVIRSLQPRRIAHRDGVKENAARLWDTHFETMSTMDLIVEVCTRRLPGLTRLTREEMRLAGYPDDKPEIDVCGPLG